MSESPGGNTRGRQRRQEILTAAVLVVANQGAGALNHRSAAAQAGVSLASTTYHFPTTADLRRETLRYAADVISDSFDSATGCAQHENSQGAELSSSLDQLIDQWTQIGIDHRQEFTAVIMFLSDSLHDAELRMISEEAIGKPAAILTQAGCPPQLAQWLIPALLGLAFSALLSSESTPGARGDTFRANARSLLLSLNPALLSEELPSRHQNQEISAKED